MVKSSSVGEGVEGVQREGVGMFAKKRQMHCLVGVDGRRRALPWGYTNQDEAIGGLTV